MPDELGWKAYTFRSRCFQYRIAAVEFGPSRPPLEETIAVTLSVSLRIRIPPPASRDLRVLILKIAKLAGILEIISAELIGRRNQRTRDRTGVLKHWMMRQRLVHKRLAAGSIRIRLMNKDLDAAREYENGTRTRYVA